jgi:hypothetical protein
MNYSLKTHKKAREVYVKKKNIIQNWCIVIFCVILFCGCEKEPEMDLGVFIKAPTFEQQYNFGENINFKCVFDNMTDIPNSNDIQWISNLDGEFGDKSSFQNALSVGRHLITVTVKTQDSDVMEDSTVVIVKPIDLGVALLHNS